MNVELINVEFRRVEAGLRRAVVPFMRPVYNLIDVFGNFSELGFGHGLIIHVFGCVSFFPFP